MTKKLFHLIVTTLLVPIFIISCCVIPEFVQQDCITYVNNTTTISDINCEVAILDGGRKEKNIDVFLSFYADTITTIDVDKWNIFCNDKESKIKQLKIKKNNKWQRIKKSDVCGRILLIIPLSEIVHSGDRISLIENFNINQNTERIDISITIPNSFNSSGIYDKNSRIRPLLPKANWSKDSEKQMRYLDSISRLQWDKERFSGPLKGGSGVLLTKCDTLHSTVISSQTSHTLPTEYMNATKDITDVDSVFETNINKLYTDVNDKSIIMINEHKILEFISVVCMMSGIDFILTNFHRPTMVEKKDVDNIRHWYDRNKSKIDLGTLKRFYVVAARPWCLNFNSFEELQDIYGNIDNYVIRDKEFEKLMKSQRTRSTGGGNDVYHSLYKYSN